jgi:inorganic pyrophosphatase
VHRFETDILVEVSRGDFVKRKPDGSVDYTSPVPAPFNYGSVPGTTAPDGDPTDALLLGERRPHGVTVRATVYGVVHLLDDGVPDDKLVCAEHPPTAAAWAVVHAFFRVWVLAKRARALVRGARGPTRFLSVETSA